MESDRLMSDFLLALVELERLREKARKEGLAVLGPMLTGEPAKRYQ